MGMKRLISIDENNPEEGIFLTDDRFFGKDPSVDSSTSLDKSKKTILKSDKSLWV